MDPERTFTKGQANDPHDLPSHLGGVGVCGLQAGQALERLVGDAGGDRPRDKCRCGMHGPGTDPGSALSRGGRARERRARRDTFGFSAVALARLHPLFPNPPTLTASTGLH